MEKTNTSILNKLFISDSTIPVILAPMAGVTDLPYRIICSRNNCDFTYSEMVSSKAILLRNRNTYALLNTSNEVKKLGVQIFGHEPSVMAESVCILCDILGEKLRLIDINMGCPAPKITSNNDGSSLMQDLPLASKIITSVTSVSRIPVTVKFRKGYDADSINAIEFAKMAEDSGAYAITIHGRTRDQMYAGIADWDIIRRVKESVTIPVIGNGDINSAKAAMDIIQQTNCDALMIGRAAQGNPFIFNEIKQALNNENYNKPSEVTRLTTALEHADLHINLKGESSFIELRKHLAWYTKSMDNSTTLRREINNCRCYNEMKEYIIKLIDKSKN